MPNPFEYSPICQTDNASGIRYELLMIQEPRFGREFTKAKRLISPHAVIALKVYSRTGNHGYKDITSRVLCQFHMNVSLQGGSNSNLVGLRFVSGSLHQPSGNQGLFVFAFPSLGIDLRGAYKLKFELFKYEGYSYLGSTDSPPLLTKISEIHTNTIEIFGIREFYRPDVQQRFQQLSARDLNEMQKDRRKHSFYSYLKKAGVIKDSNKLAETPKSPKRKSTGKLPTNKKLKSPPKLALFDVTPPTSASSLSVYSSPIDITSELQNTPQSENLFGDFEFDFSAYDNLQFNMTLLDSNFNDCVFDLANCSPSIPNGDTFNSFY